MPGYIVPINPTTNAFTPAGTISASTVNGALVELDNEKAALTYVNTEVTDAERIALMGYI